MNIRRLINILIAIAGLSMTTACYNYDRDVEDVVNTGDCYINLAISVSNGNHSTRAVPTGGEDGDGREAGFERENTVTGITLILYRDATGINTTSNPTLDLVRYFPVILETGGRETQGSDQSPHKEEARYTTGNQFIGKYGDGHHLDLGATYHAIIIANAPSVAASLIEGTSKLSDVRDVTLSTIYSGDPTMSADACTHFVMSSEQKNTINFGSVTATNLDGTPHIQGMDMLFNFTGQPIVIERMAARIDFWSANSTGYDDTHYSKKGYVYNVTGSTTDKFVVTGIVPFNLNNGHSTYGSEYLLKRQCADKDNLDVTKISRLADETTSSYVIDPQTLSKTSGTPTLTSSLSGLYTLIGGEGGTVDVESTTDNPYYHSIESMHGSTTACSTIDSKENVIVCYPMENTLLPTTPLYYYATGIAIVGYYYQGGTGAGTRYVYLGYLRHQGDDTSYEIQPYTTPLATDATMGTTTAMNFGIVRNNIYRVSIGSIDKKGTLDLKIKVKKWDPFIHDFIYM